MGSQGRHRCRVGNFPEAQAGSRGGGGGGSRNPVTVGGVDFGRDGSAWYVGAFPDERCAEVGVFPGRELDVRGKTVNPRTDNINVYWTIIV